MCKIEYSFLLLVAVVICFLVSGVAALAAQPAETAEQPADPNSVWDLTDLYPTPAAWNEARQTVLGRLPGITALKGTLGRDARSLADALITISDTRREAERVSTYAGLRADEDLRVAEAQERRQLSEHLWSQLAEATAWVDPEILRLGRAKVEGWIATEPRLGKFRHMLDNILRSAPHTLGDEAEAILAGAGQPLAAGYNIYGLLANSDIPWPEIKLSDGETVRIDSQGYTRHRQSPNRDDRKKVFDAYWQEWSVYKSSVGMTLNAHVRSQVFLSKARKYQSVLDREMFTERIPLEVYRTLVAEVNRALPTLHRYFKLRGRMLGVDPMRYYDIYPPLVSWNQTYTLEQAKVLTLEAMSVLGDDWVNWQRESMNRRWMHVYPQRGKRSGAYMNGSAYDVHPYLLLNFNGTYDSVSTFAHEWGHAMHTLYAKQAQPYETADYSTFIAEIPSTTLELILEEHMIARARNDDERLYYLGTGLEGLRGTFFRQTMFAEFELSLYEAVERGEALTGERITAMYAALLKRYHGHDQNVVVIDDLYTHEWMFIPHFYYNMYVYQYATSVTAGTALYEKIKSEGAPAVANFKNLLRAGGSDYPYELLRRAGVDLATPEPYRALVRRMNGIMDRIEVILDQRRAG